MVWRSCNAHRNRDALRRGGCRLAAILLVRHNRHVRTGRSEFDFEWLSAATLTAARADPVALLQSCVRSGASLGLLDTSEGSSGARALYESLADTYIGGIPDFALNPDGRPEKTRFPSRCSERSPLRQTGKPL
jgi:hypothetical protein